MASTLARICRCVSLIAFGHSAGDRALDDGRVALPTGLPAAAPLVSENVLRRALGLLEPPAEVDRSMGRGEIERLSGLSANLVSCLVLFDVLEPVDDGFAYRDLVAAREAARLLRIGVALGPVLDASIALRRRGGHLADAFRQLRRIHVDRQRMKIGQEEEALRLVLHAHPAQDGAE